MIGKIKRVPLREVWKHEALDFTKWLEENLDILSETIKVKLSNAEREKNAGDFSVDLSAEDEDGNTVIIENQLEKSNHDHLGKIITYLTNIGAKAAIWIVSEARPEHINAITWLNETSAASFYLLKIEAIQIGESVPAPLLTLIVGPSAEGRVIGEKKKEIAERYNIRYRFWEGLLAYAKTKTKLHANISPTEHGWLGTGAGISGLAYNYAITKHDIAPTGKQLSQHGPMGQIVINHQNTVYSYFLHCRHSVGNLLFRPSGAVFRRICLPLWLLDSTDSS